MNLTIPLDSICNTCLSTDRKLHLLKDIHLIPDWHDIGLDIQNGAVCWECKALMIKLYKFKTRAFLAQQMLHCKFQGTIQSLSRLNVTNKDTYDYIDDNSEQLTSIEVEYVEGLPKDLDVVKKEEVWSDDSNDCLIGKHLMLETQSADEAKLPDVKVEQKSSKVKSKVKKEVRDSNEDSENEDVFNKKANDYIVDKLSEEELMSFRDKEKSLVKYKRAQFKCESCVTVFYCEEQVIRHRDEVHSEILGNFVCNICLARFSEAASLEQHSGTHSVLYKCNLCTFKHYLLARMYQHTKKNHDQESYTCDVCKAVFRSKSSRKYHIIAEHKEPLKCDQCGKALKSHSSLKQHMILHTDVPMEECKVCHKRVKGMARLKLHMLSHSKSGLEESYCAECNIQFKNRYVFKMHLTTSNKHNTAQHECSHCQRKFINKRYLAKHIDVVHLNILEFGCHLCEKRFSTSTHMRNHISIHHEGGTKPRDHICDLCGKGFTTKKYLTDHVNSHTGERPYKCDKCSAVFGFSSALYTHNKLIHLKQKRGRKKNT